MNPVERRDQARGRGGARKCGCLLGVRMFALLRQGWRRAGRGLVFVTIATAGASALSTAPAGAREICASAFHSALTSIRSERAPNLAGLPQRLTIADPSLPGRWQFAGGIAIPQKRNTAAKPAAAQAAALVSESDATDDERRVAGFLADFVEAKGALPEFGPNGKWAWLLTKASAELRGYMAQSSHPALCTGAPEMMDFYGTEFGSLKRRSDDAREVDRTARDSVVARRKAWQASAPGVEAITADPVLLTTIKAVGDRLLGKADADTVAVEANVIAALALTKAALRSESASGLSPQAYRAGMALLRALELAAYAELAIERYRPLEAGLFGTTGDIRTAHSRSCTCAE